MCYNFVTEHKTVTMLFAFPRIHLTAFYTISPEKQKLWTFYMFRIHHILYLFFSLSFTLSLYASVFTALS